MIVSECHCKPAEDLVKELETHIEKGLGQGDAGARLEKYGPNELKERPRPGFLRILLDQFK